MFSILFYQFIYLTKQVYFKANNFILLANYINNSLQYN